MLIRLKDGAGSGGYMSPHPTKEESLTREVRRLAELLRQYGTDLLKGDLSDFGRIDQLEKKLAKEYGPKG
jgi:hypothetical protein